MTRKPGPAEAEEQAELSAARDRAADARQTGDTLAALAGRLAETTRPLALARRARAGLRTEAGEARWRLVRARGRMTAAVGVPAGVLVIVAASVFWQRRRAG